MKTLIRFSALVFIFSAAGAAVAQTTSFTYQGRLTDAGAPANGNYDLQFALFDAASGGTQIGSTQTVSAVSVSGGVFTVQLDFGANAFPGASRFLEIAVRPAGGGSFTVLAPRQPITSTPYALRSLNATAADTATTATNATQLGGVTASQYVQTNDARLTDARPPTAGSSNYIQNQSATAQAASFNVSGNGTIGGNLNVGGALSLNIVNAQTQYNLGGSRILRSFGTDNLVVGIGAGTNTSLGTQNVFVGNGAGASNINGSDNTYVGALAGNLATGDANSFFGVSAGFNNQGTANSFFGRSAGFQNTVGSSNSFFGVQAGRDNCGSCNAGGEGSDNSFFGRSAGQSNTTGNGNSFFGKDAGLSNTTGLFNVFVGAGTGFLNTTGNFNAFAGGTAGIVNTTGSFNSFFGESAGGGNTTGGGNSFFGSEAGFSNTTGSNNTAIGSFADVSAGNLTNATAIGANARVTNSNTMVLGSIAGINGATDSTRVGIGTSSPQDLLDVNGNIRIGLGVGGDQQMCRGSVSRQVATCGSSLRYKKDVRPLLAGLNLISRLQPINFVWKESGARDLGLGAEDVAAVEPLLVTHNENGEIEGVKYAQLSAVLINAIKEQQVQIETLRAQNAALSARLRRIERGLRKKAVARRRKGSR